MKLLQSCLFAAILGSCVVAQTVEFKVRTATYWGQHTPRHELAVWVADSMVDYLKTLRVTGSIVAKDSSVTPDATRNSLRNWNSSVSGNVSDTLDGITGATYKGHGKRSFRWDCTNRSHQVVPNGRYFLYLEMTETNSYRDLSWPPPSNAYMFTKGNRDTVISIPDYSYFDLWDQNPQFMLGIRDTIFYKQTLAYYAPSPGFVQFGAPRYLQRLGRDSVEVTVVRSRGRTGAVTVDYATGDSTALAGANYTAKTGTISFGDNDYAPKKITISLGKTALSQSLSFFTVSLSNATGGVKLDSVSRAVVVIAGPKPSVPENGLAANWNFDEGENETAFDVSGNGNHGVMHVTSWKQLDKGYAAGFDTCQAWVEVDGSPSLSIKGAVTLSAWICCPASAIADTNPSQVFLALGQYALEIHKGGVLYFGGTGYGVATGANALPAGRWCHVAAVFSGSQGDVVSAANAKIYVDNVPAGVTETGSWKSLDAPYGALVIGVPGTPRPWSEYTGFIGMLRNVYLYNRALAPSDVGALFADAPVPVRHAGASSAAARGAIGLFVNPAARTAEIRLPGRLSPAAIALFDCSGRVVKRIIDSGARSIVFTTGDCARGVYLLRVEAGGQKLRQRLLINR